MALLLFPYGEVQAVQPANGKDFKLEELQKFVGGYIEIVHPQKWFPNHIMVINEEGKLLGLDVNPIASSIYAAIDDVIVGPALLCRSSEVE